MTEDDIISLIEKPVGSMRILLHLHQNQRATITMLKEQGMNQRTTYSVLEKLHKRGLVKCEEVWGFPVCKFYSLTQRGTEVARRLDSFAAGLENIG